MQMPLYCLSGDPVSGRLDLGNEVSAFAGVGS
jgi:hypothetical protein